MRTGEVRRVTISKNERVSLSLSGLNSMSRASRLSHVACSAVAEVEWAARGLLHRSLLRAWS